MAFHRRALKSAEAVAACVAGVFRVALQTHPLWPSNVPIQSPVSPLRIIGWPSASRGERDDGTMSVGGELFSFPRREGRTREPRARGGGARGKGARRSGRRGIARDASAGRRDQEHPVLGHVGVLQVVDGARVPVAHQGRRGEAPHRHGYGTGGPDSPSLADATALTTPHETTRRASNACCCAALAR